MSAAQRTGKQLAAGDPPPALQCDGMERERLDAETPAALLLGRRVLEVDPVRRTVRVGFTARPEFLNRHGTVQGGLLAAMLDSTTALAVLAMLDDASTAVTTELDVSFVRAANAGPLTGEGRVVDASSREARSEAELLDGSGRVVARAQAVLRIRARR